ncbi:hypothetical protein F8O07_07155 [Pseudoclavibacter sp. CFCC 13796]|uniref:hypothetical protein n=1 Tax=Pseudoclavibacter sp. CFCC 13796 TaxID=2615179 RepID=UPI0013018A69|nr:hypothetical protein [Pseudoclavibacter sp. CFCC 13796]KAB1661675.1 hypothetical protein F8O07_07155 [Pseudoclavibacter sp. CFCC 13796]
MSTFNAAQHPRGNTSTGHAGQFATKAQSTADVSLGGAPDDVASELESRFLQDPPTLSTSSYHGLYMNRENWGPSLAFLPADVPAEQASTDDFIISTGEAKGAFVNARGEDVRLSDASDEHYRFVGPISDDAVVQQRAAIWAAGAEHLEAVTAFEQDGRAIFAELEDNRGVSDYDKVRFNGVSVIGTARVDGQLRRAYGTAVGGSNADGSRAFRLAVDTQGKVRTLYGDDSQKQQRYQQVLDDHPEEVARMAGHVTRVLEASRRHQEAQEALRQQTGEYYG